MPSVSSLALAFTLATSILAIPLRIDGPSLPLPDESIPHVVGYISSRAFSGQQRMSRAVIQQQADALGSFGSSLQQGEDGGSGSQQHEDTIFGSIGQGMMKRVARDLVLRSILNALA